MLRCLLCTLHDARCRAPCNTRFRLAGWPLPGGGFTRWTAMLGFSFDLHLYILPSRAWPGAKCFSPFGYLHEPPGCYLLERQVLGGVRTRQREAP